MQLIATIVQKHNSTPSRLHTPLSQQRAAAAARDRTGRRHRAHDAVGDGGHPRQQHRLPLSIVGESGAGWRRKLAAAGKAAVDSNARWRRWRWREGAAGGGNGGGGGGSCGGGGGSYGGSGLPRG